MTLTVETGAGLANSDSYVSASDFAAYVAARSTATLSGDQERALRVATSWLDAKYEPRYPGLRVNGRAQALGWPRVAAYAPSRVNDDFPYSTHDHGYYWAAGYIASNIVPREIVNATCEAAIRELAKPGILAVDQPGGRIKSVKAGSVAIDYADSFPAAAQGTFPAVDLALVSLLRSADTYSGRLVRG